MNCSRIILFACLFGAAADAAFQDKLPYSENFEKAELGKVPEEFLVLEGGFVVKEGGGNKFLELPGAPLDSFAVQFGPAESENISVAATISGTATGRRFPIFGVGLNGVAGYRLQVSPAKKELELYKDQELKTAVPYEWKSGAWLNLKLQIRNAGLGAWKIEGKAWLREDAEPSSWMITADEKEPPQPGRASVFGSPFAGTPVRFDNFKVERVGK